MSKNYLIFNGFNTLNHFLIEELPKVSTAEEKIDFIEIDGRHGYLTQSQDSYSPIDYDVQLNIYKKEDIQKVKNIFRGSGKLILSNDATKFYYARVVNKIDFERVLSEYHTCIVSFKLQPFAYELEDKTQEISNGYTFTNNTNTTCQPIITIRGTGNCVLNIGNSQINITDIQNSITLDFEMQEAYKQTDTGKENMNTHISGDFDELEIGNTLIQWSGGGVTEVSINPRFRWL